jgi:transcriptional regulator
MSTRKQQQRIEWGRSQVLELSSKGHSQSQIATMLQAVICRYIALLRQQAKEQRREKIQVLSLAKECYSMKLDLLTNATVVDDAIRFVYEKSKDKDKEDQVKSSTSTFPSDSSNEDNNKESNESEYNDDEKFDKEGEEKQEQETGQLTRNQVF